MRTHRPHNKSRKGCLTCKSRRVKCDEKWPVCGACERRDTPCSYPDMIQLADRKNKSSSSSSSSLAESPLEERCVEIDLQCPLHPSVESLSYLLRNPPRSSEVDTSNLLSEYFLHASIGLATVDRSNTRSKIYLKVIPALACQHTGISFAIYGLAMISLALKQLNTNQSTATTSQSAFRKVSKIHQDSMRHPYLHQAHRYYGKCLEVLQHDISHLRDDNIDSVIACSMLMIPFELADLRFRRRCRQIALNNSDESPTEYDSPYENNCSHHCENQPLDLNWMKFIRGLGSLLPTIQARWPTRDSPLNVMFQWSLRSDHVSFEELTESQLRSRVLNEQETTVLKHPLLPKILAQGPRALAELHSKIQNLWIQRFAPLKPESETLDANLIVCLQALEHLDSVAQYFMVSTIDEPAQGIFRVFSTWVARMDDAFYTLLCQQDILALAVYCHFLVYMIPIEDLWWIGDLGKSSLKSILFEVRGCVDCKIDTHHVSSEVRDLFSWPNKVLELCSDV